MRTADKTIQASRYTDNLAVGECDCLLLSIKVLLMYGDYYFPSNLKQLSNDLGRPRRTASAVLLRR